MAELINANNIPPAPYGLKAIREIKVGRTDTTIPTERLKKKITDTKNYFYEKVDPLIGECITFLLCEQPLDVAKAMLTYFQKKILGENIVSERLTGDSDYEPKTKKEQKQYLATSIGPVVAKLVNRIALTQPDDVARYMCTEIVALIEEDSGEILEAFPNENYDLVKNEENNDSSNNDQTILNKLSKPIAQVTKNEEIKRVEVEKVTTLTKTASVIVNDISAPKNDNEVVVESKPEASQEQKILKKSIQIAVIGIGSSGKSTILNILEGKFTANVKPTIGFRPVTVSLGDDTNIRFYDLGGSEKIKEIWEQYFHDSHGIVYVVDSSLTSEELVKVKDNFNSTLQHDFLQTKPVLLFANKSDLPSAKSVTDISEFLGIDEIKNSQKREILTYSCSSFISEDVDNSNYKSDPNIESGLESIIKTIISNFEIINNKVLSDTKKILQIETNKRLQRERKVLKNKIACAFPNDIKPEILETLNIITDPESIFDKDEGINFLSAEVGIDSNDMSPIALQIAADVGYQRLALQMVGALKAPISKKKEPMSWEQISELIVDLRKELGLQT